MSRVIHPLFSSLRSPISLREWKLEFGRLGCLLDRPQNTARRRLACFVDETSESSHACRHLKDNEKKDRKREGKKERERKKVRKKERTNEEIGEKQGRSLDASEVGLAIVAPAVVTSRANEANPIRTTTNIGYILASFHCGVEPANTSFGQHDQNSDQIRPSQEALDDPHVV